MFVNHETLPNKRKLKKIMQCPFIKSPFSIYGSDFFLKGRYYYVLITKKRQKNTFLNGISPKSCKFLFFSRFN